MENNSGAEDRFRFYYYCFYIGGVHLFNASISSLYHMYRYFCSACSVITLLAMFLDICQNREDWDHMIDGSMTFTVIFGTFCTQIYLRFRLEAVVRMLRLTDAFIWEDLPTRNTVTGSLTMAAWVPRIQRFVSIIITSAVIFHAGQSTISILTSDDRLFLYGTGYPFNTEKSPFYELINLAEGLASVPCACFFYGLPAFYGTAVCIACSQFEKLRANLSTIGQRNETQEQDLDADCDQEEGKGQTYICEEKSNQMQKELNKCVSHHQLIME